MFDEENPPIQEIELQTINETKPKSVIEDSHFTLQGILLKH